MTLFRCLVTFLLLIAAGCAGSPGTVNLTRSGIIILSPYPGQIVKSGTIVVDIRLSRKLKREGHHLHVYLNGEMYEMLPFSEPVELSGLTDGSHKVEVVLAGHKGRSHRNTKYRASVVFVVEDVEPTPRESGPMPVGLGYKTPEEVFDALLSVAVKPDMELYRKILGRDYAEAKVRYGARSRIPSKVTSISEVKVLGKGTEVLGKESIYFIFSTQVWRYSDGTVREKELDLHFIEVDGKWVYYPMKGTPFL